MPELLAFGDRVRTVKNVEFRAEAATVTASGMPRSPSRATLRQVPPQLDGLTVCGIGELCNSLPVASSM
ncbi:hypothetical protein AJ87_14165 [Rhizobium yanglingense]|nr:hypothetical protein AJ87_14165 [Rhizobium yanglingense]